MANYHKIYEGADYGFEPKYAGKAQLDFGYKIPAGTFSLPTDPRTANQLKAVSDKLSTGAKAIEVSGINTQVLESIPDQHLDEIRRLKKLAGVELTFHGPLLEPTGLTDRGWDEGKRRQVERQMFSALERAQKLEPDGNIVVTFHSSNGLPAPKVQEMRKDGKGQRAPATTEMYVIDEFSGRIAAISEKMGKDAFENKNKTPEQFLKELNERNWSDEVSQTSIMANRAREATTRALLSEEGEEGKVVPRKEIIELYKLAEKEPEKYRDYLNDLRQSAGDVAAEQASRRVELLEDSKTYAENAYLTFKDMFKRAYDVADKPGNEAVKEKLDKLRAEIAPNVLAYRHDPTKVVELSREVSKGLQVLDSLKDQVQQYKPLEAFALEKSSDTFSNLALKGYDKFQDKAPVISIENPPAGSGLATGEDLRNLVEMSQKKFVAQAMKPKSENGFGMDKDEAWSQAKKLIGVTWDVGHINMLRKYGYEDNDLVKQTKAVAPFVKNIHLSDNFGLDHTELPMGMGNVPIKEHEQVLRKQFGEKFAKIKQVIETGNWFEPFRTTPFGETLEAFGSPIYGSSGATWNRQRGMMSGYFSGYGTMLPEKNFQMYGAGFSSLPKELGGQVPGNQNRFSGTPLD